MGLKNDLDINRAVRRIFIKHWVDLGRISVRSSNGKVMIYGNLRRVEGRQDRLLPPIVDGIFYELGRIKEVRSVKGHFENWICEGGRWREYESGTAKLEADNFDIG